MIARRVFKQFLEELESISSHIYLKLPASYCSISRQIEQITLAQQQLQALKRKVTSLSSKCIYPSSRQTCLPLIHLIEQMDQTVNNLKLLAEEFLIDPEGSVSCLQSINQHNSNLPTAIDHLKTIVCK